MKRPEIYTRAQGEHRGAVDAYGHALALAYHHNASAQVIAALEKVLGDAATCRREFYAALRDADASGDYSEVPLPG